MYLFVASFPMPPCPRLRYLCTTTFPLSFVLPGFHFSGFLCRLTFYFLVGPVFHKQPPLGTPCLVCSVCVYFILHTSLQVCSFTILRQTWDTGLWLPRHAVKSNNLRHNPDPELKIALPFLSLLVLPCVCCQGSSFLQVVAGGGGGCRPLPVDTYCFLSLFALWLYAKRVSIKAIILQVNIQIEYRSSLTRTTTSPSPTHTPAGCSFHFSWGHFLAFLTESIRSI